MAGIYLAAGRSKGAGSSKGSSKPEGVFAGTASLSELERCRLAPLIVVVRADDHLKWLPPAAGPQSTRRTETCLTAHLGLSFSLRCGLNAISSMQPDAVVIAHADQPFIPAALVNRLIDTFERNQGLDYVAGPHEGITMPPALFAKSMFTALQEIDSGKGFAAILHSPEHKGIVLPGDSAMDFRDALMPGRFGENRREWSVQGGN